MQTPVLMTTTNFNKIISLKYAYNYTKRIELWCWQSYEIIRGTTAAAVLI